MRSAKAASAPLLRFANPWVEAVAFHVMEDDHHFHFHHLNFHFPHQQYEKATDEMNNGGENCIPRQGGSGSDCCESMESPGEGGETMYHIGSGVVLRLGQ